MNLQEKILYCRKKAGLSQEALSEQLGVSRQAVSKWETGDAVPELNKLLLLANSFHVTTDWLLSECDPEPDYQTQEQVKTDKISYGSYNNNSQSQFTDYSTNTNSGTGSYSNANWVDSIPGTIGKLVRRFGWLFGVYIAVGGFILSGMGALARFISKAMFSSSPFDSFSGSMMGGEYYIDQNGQLVSSSISDFATSNPVAIMGGFFIILGIIMIIVGTILAIFLKKKSKS